MSGLSTHFHEDIYLREDASQARTILLVCFDLGRLHDILHPGPVNAVRQELSDIVAIGVFTPRQEILPRLVPILGLEIYLSLVLFGSHCPRLFHPKVRMAEAALVRVLQWAIVVGRVRGKTVLDRSEFNSSRGCLLRN